MTEVDFLLEIGVEEVPDWMLAPALDQMRELFAGVLTNARLGGEVEWVEATPRRLALLARGLPLSQPDENREVSGPPASAGAGAAAGFAKKLGAAVEDLRRTTTGKGEYWTYAKHVAGRPTAELLAEALPGLITGINWPKTMYWTGKGGVRFIRPLRWIVALLGDEVVPFALAGVRSGAVTSGHRLLGSAEVPVSIVDYEQRLRENGVILRASERRERIEAALDASVQSDPALLDTLVYLTEFPTPIRGSFDPAYLELPHEILTTVMRHHQRYFSVAASGQLAPEFVAVMNTAADPEGLVRTGNERVLRARFNDARFFWDMDLRRPLGERIEDLRNVTFQAKLGSYFEKTQRVAALAREIADAVGVDASPAERAAMLAKCDLTTEMVKEFPELQGVVGGLYAREAGEPAEVWRAIYDQYKPVGMDDSIPRKVTGQVVSVADKIDTLRGCFDIGLAPTGSRDPFALRRAAQGVIKIIAEGNLRLNLRALAAERNALLDFLLERVRYYFRDVRGFRYDEINAVLAAGADDLVDAQARLEAIQAVRPTENFEPLAASFKRIQNILRQAGFEPGGTVDETLLEDGPEREMYAGFLRVREAVHSHRLRAGYRAALDAIASLRPQVDLFFDKVLVNAPEERTRHNRLLLLSSLLFEFSTIADFSEIVVTTLQ